MGIILNIIYFLGGLVAIIKGADLLTDGAASIARKFGIPTLVVGLTIVAMQFRPRTGCQRSVCHTG